MPKKKAKLAELQAEYDKLKDLEDKAKDNVIATLPDGTIVAVPKDAPTATKVDETKSAPITVTYADEFTPVKTSTAKVLPETGEAKSTLGLFGLVGVLAGMGLAVLPKRKEN